MGAFHEQSFKDRWGRMGDAAESVFEDVYPQAWERLGWDRTHLQMGAWPPILRYIPDYMTSKGMVECMGCGKDGILKLKVEKLRAMREWDDIYRCDLFVWSSYQSTYGWVRVSDMDVAWQWQQEERQFHDGKTFLAIPLESLPVVGGRDGWVWHGTEA